MKLIRKYIYENNKEVYFDLYLADYDNEYSIDKRPMVIVCPGGGYGNCSRREAEPIARKFLAEGMNSAVLYYSVVRKESDRIVFENGLSKPLFELGYLIKHIRENAEEYRTVKDNIAVAGFSAGGHLCGAMGVFFDDARLLEKLDFADIKPNAQMLIYPVITGEKGMTHDLSIAHFTGVSVLDEKTRKSASLERFVKSDTPPTFLASTAEDFTAPAINTIRFANALIEKGVSCEYHLFPLGRHGMSINTREVYKKPNYYNGRWVEFAVRWLRETVKFINI